MPRPTRKAKLVEAASQLFATNGYEETTVRDLAREAGIESSGSVYAHFGSKEELLYSIISGNMNRAIAGLSPIVESDLGAAQKLRAALRFHIRNLTKAPGRILAQWRSLGGDRRSAVREQRIQYAALWARILDQGIESGEFSVEDPVMARVLIHTAADATGQWLRADGALTPEHVADAYATILLKGIGYTDSQDDRAG